MVKNRFYSSLNKLIKNDKSFLKKKRKKTTPKYKIKILIKIYINY